MRRYRIFLLFIITQLLCSCALPFNRFDQYAGIAIYEMPSFKKSAFIPAPPGGSRDVIIHIDEKTRTIKTIVSLGGNCLLRLIDFDGKVLQEKKVLVERFHLNIFNHAISPDGKYLALSDSNGLSIIDLTTLNETARVNNFCLPGYLALWLCWVSDTQIISKQSNIKNEGDHNIVVLTDIKDNNSWSIMSAEFIGDIAFSPLNNYLAVSKIGVEKNYNGNVCIIDLLSKSVITEIDHNNYFHQSYFNETSSLCWSPDGNNLVYSKDFSKIVLLSKKDLLPHEIHKSPVLFCEGMLGKVGFLNNETIYYEYLGFIPFYYTVFRTMDINTGKIESYWRIPDFRGPIYPIDDGKKIIAEVGLYATY